MAIWDGIIHREWIFHFHGQSMTALAPSGFHQVTQKNSNESGHSSAIFNKCKILQRKNRVIPVLMTRLPPLTFPPENVSQL